MRRFGCRGNRILRDSGPVPKEIVEEDVKLTRADSFGRSLLCGAIASSAVSLVPALFFMYLFVKVLTGEDQDAQGGLIVVVGPMIVVVVFTVLTIVFTAACEAYRSMKYREHHKYWVLNFSVAVFLVLVPIIFVLALYMR